jgi:predicted nicotinamide N-methyase
MPRRSRHNHSLVSVSESECESEKEEKDEIEIVRVNDSSTRQLEVNFLGKTFIINQDPTALDHAAVLWDAALVLLGLIEEDPSRRFTMTSKRILELGAGTGLLSIALAKCLDCRVTCTDLPFALDNIQKNTADNYLNNTSFQTKVYEFGDISETTLHSLFLDKQTGEEKPFDFIIGTDVAYSEKLNPLLIKSAAAIANRSNKLFTSFHTQHSCTILFANELRCELAQAIFEKSAISSNIIIKRIPQKKIPTIWRKKQMLVFEMKMKSSSHSGIDSYSQPVLLEEEEEEEEERLTKTV